MDLVPTILISSTLMSCHNGRVVKQLDRFMYLGEFFEAILEEHEIDPIYYDDKTHKCKLVYKRNNGVDRKVEIYVARL